MFKILYRSSGPPFKRWGIDLNITLISSLPMSGPSNWMRLAFILPVLYCLALQAQEPCDVSLESTQPTCPGDSDGSITVVGGPGPYTYFWDHDATLTDATAEDLPAGFYTVYVSDANGCYSELEFILTDIVVPPLGSITVTDITCAGNDDGTATFELNAGAPNTWQWVHAPNETNAALTGLGPGTYAVLITDPPNCPSFVFGTLGDPGMEIMGEIDYCPADPPSLLMQPVWGFQPHVFAWSTGETSNPIQIEAGTEGMIEITAVDTISGCTASTDVFLTQLPSPFVEFAVPDSICQELDFIAYTTNTDADSLVWRWQGSGLSFLADPVVRFSEPYWQPISLQGFDAFGCGGLAVHDSIYVHPLKRATYTVEQIPCSPVVAIDLQSIADSCAFFVFDSLRINDCSGKYTIDLRRYQDYEFTFIATQPNMCNDTVMVTLDVRTEPTMFLPNAFTPDGDGINDEWPGPVDLPELSYELRIYDRWGAGLWATNDPMDKWTGDDHPTGVYVYTMRMRDPCELTNEVATKGYIMLMR